MHVAMSRDLYLQGGYIERHHGALKTWPWLYLHVKFGDHVGAIWANRPFQRFLLVLTVSSNGKMKRETELSVAELAAFKARDGVFWTLAGVPGAHTT